MNVISWVSPQRPEPDPKRTARNRRRYLRRQANPQTRLADQYRRELSTTVRHHLRPPIALDLLGCTIPEFVAYLEDQFDEHMTWGTYGVQGWHIDHIRPLSSFDLTDPEQRKQACHYTNLQPMWGDENIRKGAKLTHDLSDNHI